MTATRRIDTAKPTHGIENGVDEGLLAHMNKVYGTMSAGLLITFAAAWAIAGLSMDEGRFTALGTLLYASPLKWVLIFAPLAFVLVISFGIHRLSAAAAQIAFYGFAAVMGVSMSSIFIVYTGMSIAQTFLVTAAAFAGLSLWGYTTKRDLSGMGTFLMMGLIGLIVAMIVNLFVDSEPLGFAVSVIGVLIFAGLTVYETQRIKTDYLSDRGALDGEGMEKTAIIGALNLYLNFLNMFIFMLQLMGVSGDD